MYTAYGKCPACGKHLVNDATGLTYATVEAFVHDADLAYPSRRTPTRSEDGTCKPVAVCPACGSVRP